MSSSNSTTKPPSFIFHLKQMMDHGDVTTSEERKAGILVHDSNTLSSEKIIKESRFEFGIFTKSETSFSQRQLSLFSLIVKTFERMTIDVVSTKDETVSSIRLNDFVRDHCSCVKKSSFKLNEETFQALLPNPFATKIKTSGFIPSDIPSSIDEFDVLFSKLASVDPYNIPFTVSHKSEDNPLLFLRDITRKKFPDVCTRCMILFSLLYFKKIFTESLYLNYPPKNPNRLQFQTLSEEISKVEYFFKNKACLNNLQKFRHNFYRSLLLECHFTDLLIQFKKIFRKKFIYFSKKDYQFIEGTYGPRDISLSQVPNAINCVALYLGYDTTNVVDITMISIVMINAWFSKYNVSNPHFFSPKSTDASIVFYLVDNQTKKLLFTNLIKQ